MSQQAVQPLVVYANNYSDNKKNFGSNYISTARYRWWNFIPLNLFNQFRKVSNFYFLIIMIVALIPNVSPLSPLSSVLPLIFVVGVAMIKDGYEDFKRHQADRRANSSLVRVLRVGSSGQAEMQEIPSADVVVGDYVYLTNGDEVRADLLLLSSSGPEGGAFIETANLDGETNLKGRKAPELTASENFQETLHARDISIQTMPNDPNLHDWTGVMRTNGQEVSVGIEQFLYRSCIVKNTQWCYGVVLYTGKETKMMKNLTERPHKVSNLEKKLNYLVGVLMIFNLLALIACTIFGSLWNKDNRDIWYLQQVLRNYPAHEINGTMPIFRFLTYFILLSFLIPISLFVTLELCKLVQARLMLMDHRMFKYMNGKWEHCRPNTSDLNEQLAQVKFIFTDKTGTLTENRMNYKRGDILGERVDSEDWGQSNRTLWQSPDPQLRARSLTYFKALALCHTIQPFDDDKCTKEFLQRNPLHRVYDGASPDEIALVKTAVEHNVILVERSTRKMDLVIANKPVSFEILATLEFTPDRKMMSIIVREPDGRIQLYTKGADSFVIPRLNQQATVTHLPPLVRELGYLGKLGLRTLIVAGKTITQAEFNEWNAKFIQAGKSLTNRSKIVDEVCLMMEKNLDIIGLTAIEDKLQEEVPETLQFFLQAGVVIWMLTGDKRETAVTIAATSSLANPARDAIIHIDIGDNKRDSTEAANLVASQLNEIENAVAKGDRNVTFVIDGAALEVVMAPAFNAKFVELSQRVNSAVCCRLTPLQKSRVVDMFQTTTGSTALAIGDGANDVSMIQKGRVGVGIVGLEGAQAALAADYAVPRFKHLKPLCCIHGRYAQVRNALCITYSFYKNVCVALFQFYYVFYCGGSGMTFFEGWLITFFNVLFTSLSPLAVGFFEKDIPEEPLLNMPELFPAMARGKFFDWKALLQWFGSAIIHSLALFFAMFQMQMRQDTGSDSYRVGDSVFHGTIVLVTAITLVSCKLALHIHYWQWMIISSIIVAFVLVFLFLSIYAALKSLLGQTFFYWVPFLLFGQPKFWLFPLLVIGALIVSDLFIITLRRHLFPLPDDAARELDYRPFQEKNAIIDQLNTSEVPNKKNDINLEDTLNDDAFLNSMLTHQPPRRNNNSNVWVNASNQFPSPGSVPIYRPPTQTPSQIPQNLYGRPNTLPLRMSSISENSDLFELGSPQPRPWQKDERVVDL